MSEIKVGMFLESTQESFKTDVINGKLDAIIVDTDKKIELIIESSLGYIIYKNSELYGCKYICPRATTTSAEAKLLDINQYEQFMLNEEIYITVVGPKKTNINFVIRYHPVI